MAASEINRTQRKRGGTNEGRVESLLFAFFSVNFSTALYYLNAWIRLFIKLYTAKGQETLIIPRLTACDIVLLGMQYSQQAMSTMWCKAYGPSQLMNFVPQVSTMQAPVSTVRTAPPNKATPSTPRRVSRSADITEMPTEDSSISYPDDQEF